VSGIPARDATVCRGAGEEGGMAGACGCAGVKAAWCETAAEGVTGAGAGSAAGCGAARDAETVFGCADTEPGRSIYTTAAKPITAAEARTQARPNIASVSCLCSSRSRRVGVPKPGSIGVADWVPVSTGPTVSVWRLDKRSR